MALTTFLPAGHSSASNIHLFAIMAIFICSSQLLNATYTTTLSGWQPFGLRNTIIFWLRIRRHRHRGIIPPQIIAFNSCYHDHSVTYRETFTLIMCAQTMTAHSMATITSPNCVMRSQRMRTVRGVAVYAQQVVASEKEIIQLFPLLLNLAGSFVRIMRCE